MCFVVIAPPLPARHPSCFSTERSLSATRPTAVSIIARVVNSVQHHRAALPSSGYHFFSGSPPMILCPSSRRVDGVRIFAGLDHELVESRRTGEQHLRMFAELIGRVSGLGQVLLCQFAHALLAVYGHEDVAISATSAWLVQIFEVAFSRRMCCSRVDSVSTKPRLPFLSTVSPAKPARHLADELLLCGEYAAVGTAEAERHAERLRFHGHDVGVRGGRRSRATRLRRSTQSAARRACARSRQWLDVFDRPKKFGD